MSGYDPNTGVYKDCSIGDTPKIYSITPMSKNRDYLAGAVNGNKHDLVHIDLNTYSGRVLATYDCPGSLWETDRAGSRVAVTCHVQPNPKRFVFRHVWTDVVDLETNPV